MVMFILLVLLAVYMGWLIAVGLFSFAFQVKLRAFVAVLGAVMACGSLYGTVGPQQTDALWGLALYMEGVRKALRRAHRVRGTLPYRGGRRETVRAHARSVVKCLNAAEARIDVDGDEALIALVVLLGQVADRYADGRLGALLDEEKLTDYPAGRDWEALRLAFLAVVIAAGAVGTGFLALSDPATVVLIAGVGVLGVALLYRNLRNGVELPRFVAARTGWCPSFAAADTVLSAPQVLTCSHLP
ncbi:hypothetical protein [Streptomyces acidicola]|uniref:hypothetical protein n=1 Tax=Streptomyces acidicola TaxID=2596892 RepID=UPI00341C9E29